MQPEGPRFTPGAFCMWPLAGRSREQVFDLPTVDLARQGQGDVVAHLDPGGLHTGRQVRCKAAADPVNRVGFQVRAVDDQGQRFDRPGPQNGDGGRDTRHLRSRITVGDGPSTNASTGVPKLRKFTGEAVGP